MSIFPDLTRNLRLVLVSDFSTSVRISFHPSLGQKDRLVPLKAGQIGVQDFDPEIFTMNSDDGTEEGGGGVAESKGIRLTAEKEFVVYGINRESYSTDAFLGKVQGRIPMWWAQG